jgi:small subunit ribosomal protein S20
MRAAFEQGPVHRNRPLSDIDSPPCAIRRPNIGCAPTDFDFGYFEEFMANTPQAKKRIRRNQARAAVNKNRVSRIRTLVKKVETAVAAGDKSAAATALQAAQPEMARGVAKGVLHKNTVARKFARLTKSVNAIA